MRELVKCPDCGADMQVGDVAAYVPHLERHNLVGVGVVILHAIPLCDALQRRHDNALEDTQHMVADLREREEREKREREEDENSNKQSK